MFRKRESLGAYYRLIFAIKSNRTNFIVTFFHDFTTDQYQTVVMEENKPKVEQGDYKWNCKSNNANKSCTLCEGDNFLSEGRCYPQIAGCSLQVGPNCYICKSDYTKNGPIC